ncbi:hypothetical protein SDC9_152576 [bioreactor metagenome]|uniref:Uncharacterized protein n=1 Tax=bioreactor metagenome TaxID=1076179 RepID=A0A645EV70_9ZZZZ
MRGGGAGQRPGRRHGLDARQGVGVPGGGVSDGDRRGAGRLLGPAGPIRGACTGGAGTKNRPASEKADEAAQTGPSSSPQAGKPDGPGGGVSQPSREAQRDVLPEPPDTGHRPRHYFGCSGDFRRWQRRGAISRPA